MSERITVVTNVLDYAGPPAVQALLESGHRVIAHDPSFIESAAREAYTEKNPGAVPVETQNPKELIHRDADTYI